MVTVPAQAYQVPGPLVGAAVAELAHRLARAEHQVVPAGNDRGLRVASLIASGTEIVAALGVGASLVGRSHSCDYPSWVARLPALTTPKIDPEAPSGDIDAAIRGLMDGKHHAYEIDAGGAGAASTGCDRYAGRVRVLRRLLQRGEGGSVLSRAS